MELYNCFIMQSINTKKLYYVAVLLCMTAKVTDGLTAHVDPELILWELGAADVNCTASNHNSTNIEYRWTRPADPDWDFVYSQVLELSQVTLDQAGIYTCEVRDPSTGNVASDSMELIIHYVPRWDANHPQKAAGYEGTMAEIKCVVTSLPTPSFYWLKNNINVTSSEYIITSQGNVSTLQITSVKTSDFGTFECSANNYVGGRNFSIPFSIPGIPDSPDHCHLLNVTAYNATLQCNQGYDGGEPTTFAFTVHKTTVHEGPIEVETTFTWIEMSVAHIVAQDLDPNQNYTLLVYQQNKFGRSDSSFGVLVNTLDGPPLSKKMSTEMIAIIAGSVGGAVLVIVIIIIVCCTCRKPKSKDPTPKPKKASTKLSVKKKDVQAYVMEDDSSSRSTPHRDQSRSPLKELRNSFRMQRKPRALSAGINNPNYVPDDGQSSPRIILDYNGEPSNPERSNNAYFININHNPGETAENPEQVYENAAYLRESRNNLNTSLSSSVPSVIQRQISADPAKRAQRQSQDQPGLAGFGALQDLNVLRLADGPIPTQPLITPTIRKEVRLSLRPPSFEPEVPWEFPRESLFVRLKVGEGTFGEVWRAKADGILGRSGRLAVAVKMLKVHYTPEERRSLIKELEIMKLLQPHPNIIQLLGCCTKTEPICIIMEYAANGNLQDLLRRQRSAFSMNDLSRDSPESNRSRNINLQLKDLKRFGLHVASGMEYIASRELLHRDLAARNILVDENLICKVSDFGSARDVIEMRQYESKTQRRLPIRWMPPESLLQCVYTVHSDVWSFGVFLWEVITLGSSPYPGMGGPDVMDFVQKGCRMHKPKHCSDALYAVMKDCWNHFPPKRPSFNLLRHRMIAILDEPGDEIYVDQMCDNAYDIVEDLPGEKC